MEFGYTAEQEALIRTLRAFGRRELAPRSREWDRTGVLDRDVVRQMGALGLLGLRVPAEYGGQETDLLTMGLAVEEIARADFGSTSPLQQAGLVGGLVGMNGTEEVKRQWLPPVVRGDAIVALALTEPGVGSDAARLACRAEGAGDAYVITGEKSGITYGMPADATIVFATTDAAARARGVTAFLVPLDLPGISRSPLRDLGCRSLGRALISFDHVRVPVSHRLGAEGTGFHQVMQGFDYNRVMIALSCLGTAQASLDETMDFVKTRQAFGRPLARFEGVSFPIAEAATQLDAARWLCYRALWMADHGQPYTKDAAMAKWWAPKLAVETIHQCLLLHGHYGYTEELPFEQRLRDVMGMEIGDGTAEIMKVVIARELMGRASLPY